MSEIERIRERFRSGNNVPVPDIRLSRKEWGAIESALAQAQAEERELCGAALGAAYEVLIDVQNGIESVGLMSAANKAILKITKVWPDTARIRALDERTEK